MYFSYNANNGFSLHKTAQEAKESAEKELNAEREAAMAEGEWYDEVLDVCWGKVSEQAAVTKIESCGEGQTWYDYGLKAT